MGDYGRLIVNLELAYNLLSTGEYLGFYNLIGILDKYSRNIPKELSKKLGLDNIVEQCVGSNLKRPVRPYWSVIEKVQLFPIGEVRGSYHAFSILKKMNNEYGIFSLNINEFFVGWKYFLRKGRNWSIHVVYLVDLFEGMYILLRNWDELKKIRIKKNKYKVPVLETTIKTPSRSETSNRYVVLKGLPTRKQILYKLSASCDCELFKMNIGLRKINGNYPMFITCPHIVAAVYALQILGELKTKILPYPAFLAFEKYYAFRKGIEVYETVKKRNVRRRILSTMFVLYLLSFNSLESIINFGNTKKENIQKYINIIGRIDEHWNIVLRGKRLESSTVQSVKVF